MTGAVVAGSVALFLLVLLFCPVLMLADFEQEFSFQIRYLFLRFRLYPQPIKQQHAGKEAEEPAAEEKKGLKKLKETLQEKGLSGFLEILRETAALASDTMAKFLPHLVISRFSLLIAVAGEDAASTALNYGHVCAAVFPLLGILFANIRCRKHYVRIEPDFQAETSRVKCSVKAKISLIFIVYALLTAFFRGIRIITKFKTQKTNSES